MSLFNLNRPKEEQPVSQAQETTAAATRARQLALPVDIYEGTEELLLLADLPGVEPEGLSVSFEASELRIDIKKGTNTKDWDLKTK